MLNIFWLKNEGRKFGTRGLKHESVKLKGITVSSKDQTVIK
jgi:hypothetical protein